MKKLLAFCFLLSCPISGETCKVSVKKCCPDGQVLDDKTNDCTVHSGATFGPVVELTGINFNKSVHDPYNSELRLSLHLGKVLDDLDNGIEMNATDSTKIPDRTVPINVTFVGTGKPELSATFERHVFKTGKDMTRYGEICINTCGQHEGTEYFWCKTKYSWDYCSTDHKHTIYNEICYSNCAKEGTSYYWCPKELTQEQVDTCTKESSVWDYCSPGKESETWLTVEGKLVTSRYEKEFDHGDFCVDKDNSDEEEIVALMSDPCKGSKHCLNLCCPHGHVQRDHMCVLHNETIDWNPEYWNGPDIMEAQERNTHYILSAPTKLSNLFTCPNNRYLVETENDLADWKLQINGILIGDFSKSNMTDIETFQTNEFCLVYGDPFPEYDDDGEEIVRDDPTTLEMNYMKCQKEEEKHTSTKVTRRLYPVAIGISTVFLFVVLVVMYLDPTLRTGLFGRITVGFVANVFVGYIIICFTNNGDIFNTDSSPCVAAGYITQYSFLAFFFWLNAMAINICLKFSRASQFRQSAQDEGKKFWFYFGYAQAGPLVICIITAMVDHFGHKSACNGGQYGNTALLPNMGVYSCFFSAGAEGKSGTYFGQPEFLYFQLFIIIIQILNIACFSTTVYFLNKHWNETNQVLDKSKKQKRENVFVVIKLFVIMGIPWIFEIISSIIEFNHQDEEWFQKHGFAIRIILDIPNLFTGFLIFLVLVCKKTVLQNLRGRIRNTSADTFEMDTKATTLDTKSST